MIIITHAQLSPRDIKCPPFLVVFGVTLARVKLRLHAFTYMTVTLPKVEAKGSVIKKIVAAENCIVLSEKFMERLDKKN